VKVEILFHTSSTPKVIDAYAVYTKDGLCCIECMPGRNKKTLIIKYPLCNIFSITSEHQYHRGTSK